MDLADDVAYSVHDVEDGVVAERIDLSRLDHEAVWEAVRDWYLPDVSDERLRAALDRLRSVDGWPTTPYDGSRRQQAALKNLTSDLIGRLLLQRPRPRRSGRATDRSCGTPRR